ncbi:glycosyltransferase [Phenylobacterium sp.]|uniref:glycosyltransferase family 2 protein n=1 Tax=Phenylobacterium sp. TaxID=1871053 RepID=UPI002731E82D|nr:glycosyltransferase [Phenylobacterium sp.]MDP1873220.1 glycosyltransferase [Phenylobacterium sp.]
MSEQISLIIPTQRRLSGLSTAARSLFAQQGVERSRLELVVVDNDQQPSARETVEALAVEAPFPVVYVHEPEPGVANARNAAMARAQGDLIAFLDDDEEAPSSWLADLLSTRSALNADVVFGPVRGRAPPQITRHRDYLETFFSRLGPPSSGLIEGYYGCGNSLLRRAALPDPHAPFSALRNHTGGEDDLLFGQMKAHGARFAWSAEAFVWEDPVLNRLSLDYTIRRAFAYGQGPSAACAAATPPNYPGLVFWMAQGLVQAGVFGLLAGFKWLIRAPDLAFTLDRAARGLGKTLWWGPFKIEFYGRSAA